MALASTDHFSTPCTRRRLGTCWGVPNPLATVKLCNATAQAGLDGSAVVTAYTKELCRPTVETLPISPYTAAVAATATAIALKKRRK
jgi:hypothetical protein